MQTAGCVTVKTGFFSSLTLTVNSWLASLLTARSREHIRPSKCRMGVVMAFTLTFATPVNLGSENHYPHQP
ncbi:hypothetical protein EDD17DRAFT_1533216 [Pisolithus thermaeus]|nr:hypothetical protein EDD17DRAFT_1533216 [Pisolithus thermaeus]